MNFQKGLLNLATLTTLGFMTIACNSGSKADLYAEGLEDGKEIGYTQGYDVGYDDGYADGDEAGYARAKDYFASTDYNAGFTDGKAAGVQEGYANGYTVGKQDGVNIGYSSGYNAGYSDGDADGFESGYALGYDDGYLDGGSSSNFDAGFNAGYTVGYDDGASDGYTVGYDDGASDGYILGYDDGSLDGYDVGYNDGASDGYMIGYDDGSLDGYDFGYEDGFGDGYDVGYDDGWSDGYGLSVGPAKKLKGYSNLLSMVHDDLFDYSKIPAPKLTRKGLVANGRLILSDLSQTNKDTLKRKAVVEQYLVAEMANQVKGKFGLSNERSLKIAKAANHFRKFSSKRALTPEDTDAYASEIIGSDFATITEAYKSSLQGDLSSLNDVLEKAAEKNNVSPEEMSTILTKFFI